MKSVAVRTAPFAAVAMLCGCSLLPKLFVGVALSGLWPEDDKMDMDVPLQGDVWARIDLIGMQLEASYGMKTYTWSQQAGSVTETGELEVKPLAAMLKVMIGHDYPHLLLGGGVVFNDISGTKLENLDYEKADMYRVSLGVEFRFEELILAAEAMYDIMDSDITVDPLNPLASTFDVNMSGLMARLALGFRF